MEKLINLLHTGGYSCTIANGGKIRTFTQRGVADLYDLLTQEPEFLKGALIADKVVGKGAAALMILGGIKELYTDIISTKALELFRKSDVKVDFAQEVAFIWNRDRTFFNPIHPRHINAYGAKESNKFSGCPVIRLNIPRISK